LTPVNSAKRGAPRFVIVLDPPGRPELSTFPVWTADEYLEGKRHALEAAAVVLNLCKSYQYLSKGYYVSLLADARGQRIFPTLEMIEEINNPFAYFRVLRESGLDTIDFKVVRGGRRLLPRVIVPEPGKSEVLEATEHGDREKGSDGVHYRVGKQAYIEITSVFGKTLDRRFQRQARAIFRLYSFPLMRIRMYHEAEGWKIGQVFPAALPQLTPGDARLLAEELGKAGFVRKEQITSRRKPHRIACLFDPSDQFKPSWEDTLEKFERVALRKGALFEVIGKDDLARLPEYDALFIRTVTALDHFSFTFAQQAQSLGMPVIDDPQSIMKCSNKVYLHELFAREDIPTPRTIIVSRRTPREELMALGLPLIIKLPQGTFSAAVKKAEDKTQLENILREMFKESPLLIVQEFAPTAFDWRICVLEGRMLFACRYYQAKDHWQIARRFESGFTRFGKVEAVPAEKVPPAVKKVALKGSKLIGNGLYGVDIKELNGQALMIEINDNPNIDTGYEDTVEKDRVYEKIITCFLRRVKVESELALKPPGMIAKTT
jgi:glutathione synthase/RimK-type ligase-like ATP-grasp enzyme